MAEDETIEPYMLRVNEAVNAIRGLGEEIKDPVIVKKVLRSLLPRPKATDKTAAFKVQMNKQIEPKSDEDDTDADSDDGEINFVRKLKRGKDKYRGKLPFKCFNYGGVGHFAAKCPHKDKEADEEPKQFKKKKPFLKKGKSKSKGLISKHHKSTSDDSFEDESDDDTADESLSMVLSDITEKSDEHPTTGSDNDDEDAEVDLERELIAALNELKTERKSHKKTAKQLKEAEKKMLEMKVQIKEFKKVVDELETQLSLKSGDYCKLEEEVVMLRNKVDIYVESILSPSDPQTDKLDEKLSCQRPEHIKFGLGYEGESSKQMVKGKGIIEDPIQLKKVPHRQNRSKLAHQKSWRYAPSTRSAASLRKMLHTNHMQERKNPIQPKTTNVKTIWVKKKDVVENSSMVVKTTLKAQNKPMPWLLDSGCSHHMTGNKEMFKKYQQYDGGSVRFSNNDGGKIIGKGIVSFGRKAKSHDVLYMTGLRHNLLSISQICDKGQDVIFSTYGCEIKKSSNGKLVAVGTRTSGNLYMLTDEMEGYSSQSKAYRCYNKRLKKLVESADVTIDEKRAASKDPTRELPMFEDFTDDLEDSEIKEENNTPDEPVDEDSKE
ncbi:uncharacterized protein LOC122647574 [Telopea speciosissima]|uniref:uncharacterized protein LOC122647574 n=1 Tax=Telopea speciosissima TaxID=54955 RepID=UPI001CC79B9A|nr:uncharacterized protein LOC122647574 [Telopea speciosissima]